MRINPNLATEERLAELRGVGPHLARRIVEYRANVGRFRTVEELAAVAGLSERMVDRIRDAVTLEGDEGDDGPAELASATVFVRVEREDGQPADFSSHKLRVSFEVRESLDGDASVVLPSELVFALPANGRVEVALPNKVLLVGQVRFAAIAPDGALLAQREVEAAKLSRELTLQAAPAEFASTVKSDDPAFGRPTRLRGRVIDARGERQINGAQVVIWAADKPDPEERDFRALLVVSTDGSGYFSGPYPAGSFSSANGAVAFGGDTFTEPIHLEDDGFFPESLILVLDLAELEIDAEACADCKTADVPRDPDNADLVRADGTFSSDAGGGKCVDFTTPDRTLEEFTYSYVVRTSEPEIKGLTLEEPAR